MLNEVQSLVRLHELEYGSNRDGIMPNGQAKSEQERCRSEIPPALLARYEQLKWRYGSTALVESESGTCSGCRMALPRVLHSRLKSGVARCDHCARLLYDPDAVYTFQ